jgi:hypothetical protein
MKNTRRTAKKPPMTAARAAELLQGVDRFDINFHPNRSLVAEAARFGIDFDGPEVERVPYFASYYLHIPGNGYWYFNQQIGYIPVPLTSPALQMALRGEAVYGHHKKA